jgi:putative transposase
MFLDILREARDHFHLSLYNYCLMTNHVHLLFKVCFEDTLSKVMHWMSTTFSRKFNKLAGRKGHLWEGRFRSAIIEEASYFFRCMAYLDLNPVRAGLAATPIEYRWCGHRALREENAAELDVHPLYLEMGCDTDSRYPAYMKLLTEEAARPQVSLATEHFVGTSGFVNRMERKFGLDQAGRFLHRKDLGSGIVCVGPRVGQARSRV